MWRGMANVYKAYCPDCKEGIKSFDRETALVWWDTHRKEAAHA